MNIRIVKKNNKNVWIIDDNSANLIISLSPEVADLKCVNGNVKITQKNGNVETINPMEVVFITVESYSIPIPILPTSCDNLLNILSEYFFLCCSAQIPAEPA